MKTKLLLCAVGLASLLLPEKAQSQVLKTTFLEINPSIPVNGTFDGSYFYNYPSGTSLFDAYEVDFQFRAFCVEPTQSLSYGQAIIYDVQDPASLENATAIAKLMGGYLASSMSVVDAAAVQWAIWEVVAELSPVKSLADGNVRIDALDTEDSEVAFRADYFLANIDSFTAVPMHYLTNPEGQDVATWMEIPNLVPEPTSAALVALSGLALLRRRRR